MNALDLPRDDADLTHATARVVAVADITLRARGGTSVKSAAAIGAVGIIKAEMTSVTNRQIRLA